jgi:hypothetical protein
MNNPSRLPGDYPLFIGDFRLEASQRRLLEEHGNNDNIRPFAHPYYWAAFTFTGV